MKMKLKLTDCKRKRLRDFLNKKDSKNRSL